jgi:serine/threonine protein kinase
MHDVDIIHKNLKLTNIFLTKENKVKLSDLGIDEMIRCNKNSTFLRNYVYLAPEII